MSKAPGVPLSFVYSRLNDTELRALLRNLARLIIPLFAHRFPQSGSLYQTAASAPKPTPPVSSSGLSSTSSSPSGTPSPLPSHDLDTKKGFIVGPIVSWPFFGEGRGDLDSTEIDRGPWTSEREYIEACARREIDTVRREAAGTEKGHRPHLPPKSKLRGRGSASRTHSRSTTAVSSLRGLSQFPPSPSSSSFSGRRGVGHTPVTSNESDSDSDSSVASSGASESSEEGNFYRDYRFNLRSSLLVAQHAARLQSVTNDMDRFMRYMTELGIDEDDPEFAPFTFHAHDLSLANIFVDPEDHSTIVNSFCSRL